MSALTHSSGEPAQPARPKGTGEAIRQTQLIADIIANSRTVALADLYAVVKLSIPAVDYPRVETIVSILHSAGLVILADDTVTWVGQNRN